MQFRMGVALMVVIAGSLAVGCANKQHKSASREKNTEQAERKREMAQVKRQQKQEQEQARAQEKRLKDQARAEQKLQQQEAKRMAAQDKRRREEDRRMAEKARKEHEKYEREQKDAFASDIIRDERQVRALDRFAQASAAAGAREDLMLTDAHFDGGELNALGRGKVALIARTVPAGSARPVVVYVGGADEAAAQPRIAAVQSYWQATPHADLQLELKPGVNDARLAPASAGLAGLRKMEVQKSTGRTTNINIGAGVSGGSTGSSSAQ